MTNVQPHISTKNTLSIKAQHLIAIALFAFMALCSHAIFLPQFFSFESAAFTYYGGDSTSQLIPALSLLERNLLEGNIFWSWEYGFGGDLYSDFSYYYTTSPFFYLQFAIKALLDAAGGDFYTTQQWRLIFSILKEIICMGLMYALLRQEKHRWLFAICGAIIYGCSYWFIDNSFAIDFVTDAMIWPPLIVLAFNRFNNTKSWIPLLLAVAGAIANSFYFGYINCIFCILFALVFSFSKQENVKNTLLIYSSNIGKLACIAVGAFCLAAIAFLPSVFALFSADRTSTVTSFNWFPTFDFIKIIPDAFFFKGAECSYIYAQTFAFPIAVLLVFFISFRRAESITCKKTLFAFMTIVIWILPIAASIMNGFSHPYNRWCYLVVFAIAYAFPNWMESIITQQRLSTKTMGIIASIIVLLVATHDWRTQNSSAETGYVFSDICGSDILLFILGFLFIVCLFFIQKQLNSKHSSYTKYTTTTTVAAPALALFFFICATILAMPYGPYAQLSGFRNNSGVEQFSNPEELSLLFEGNTSTKEAYKTTTPSDTEFFRTIDEEATYDSASFYDHAARYENRSWLNGSYPTSTYNSLVSKQINQWLKLDYQVTSTTKSASQYRGLGNRLFLENTWGVQHKFNINDSSQLYGYTDGNNDGVWDNEYALGLDLWYDSFATPTEWKNWSIAQKDAALLQTAVVNSPESTSSSTLTHAQLEQTIHTIPLTAENVTLQNCTFSDNQLSVKENGTITIALPKHTYAGEHLLSFDLVRNDEAAFYMTVNDISYWSCAKDYRWGYPVDSYSIAITHPQNEIIITLDEGTYTLDNAVLEFSSYESLEEWTRAVNQYSLDNLKVSNNHISGTINNQTDGILALSIPYSKGWTCTVDGTEVETFEVNGIFTGMYLEATETEEHQIELTYKNQIFHIGLYISTVTALLIAIILVINKRKNSSKA